MKGLHILLTYSCNFKCDHCFVWGSPRQTGTFTLEQLEAVFQQALDLGTIKQIYFEGGEVFLHYPLLLRAVARATELGFWTGVVSNGFWARDLEKVRAWVQPLVDAGLKDLSVSIDSFHNDEGTAARLQAALEVIRELGLPVGSITINQPRTLRAPGPSEKGEPITGGSVRFRGRAAERLAPHVALKPWAGFTTCPHEKLADPGRVHLDSLGNLHLCQGLLMGNLFERPLKEIVQEYDPDGHPIVGPLLAGGPAELARTHDLEVQPGYADACHLCYTARLALRPRFPELLGPDQMYGG